MTITKVVESTFYTIESDTGHLIYSNKMSRYEEVSILEGSVLGPGPHYWGLGAQQTKARPAKRYRKCLVILTIPATDQLVLQ